MTIFEKLAAFAADLPPARRVELEKLISDIMASEGDGCGLSSEQLAELDRRMADPNPKYATDEEVEAFFARYRTA